MMVEKTTENKDAVSGGGTAGNGGNGDAGRTVGARRPWNAGLTPAIGKTVRWASRLLHHGGSAFPGRVVEQIDPGFLARTLGRLPLGVVLVSGTNGKTTTTRMVASMLADLGLKVFTNPTGSNFTRGVVSALLEQVTLGGGLDADIAVLELDEAYAVHFVRQVRPRYALLLNVMRDQLDRFGEIDNTARLLGHVAEATTGTVVLNREDPRIARLAGLSPDGTDVRYFGLSADLRRFFPSDDDMATTVAEEAASVAKGAAQSLGIVEDDGQMGVGQSGGAAPAQSASARHASGSALGDDLLDDDLPDDDLPADVTLIGVGDHHASFAIDGRTADTAVKLEGVYNLYNAAAALAVVRAVQLDARHWAVPMVCGGDGSIFEGRNAQFRELAVKVQYDSALSDRLRHFGYAGSDALFTAVSHVTPAFGRGETITVNGADVQLLLVKNPMGFRLSLGSFPPDGHDTMIVINDEYADGRDMSWLWDVDFTSLRPTGVAMVSGTRAWDMALRLEYDQVKVDQTGTDLESAVARFVKEHPGRPKHIYCTYTAMLRVRAELAKLTDVADAGVGR
ncbi:Mur ligase family protein [Bifidobacterium leontopitheci]|uniref:Lipid II isoglutaminyl synthase (glutamine-hydrolyzing) subunit MurT n=1 Tax=Bifidobacterium leontopitheci TaxID=2650774 RepID=A0A6I1GLG5_9BIFI|nr:Mur ligase family protein [Bifidobacterium leontopitheci]KAB7790217.1 glutamate ligase [Bifidobacterium leontopitheci]